MSKILIIKVTQEEIFLTNDLSIGIKHTNFHGKDIIFKKEILFWEAEMVKFRDGILYLKILDFYAEKEEFGCSQPKAGYSIGKIEFDKFDKNNFEPLLSSYKRKDLNELCGIEDVIPPSENVNFEYNQIKFHQENSQEKPESITKTEIIKENFFIGFEEFEIITGGIRFKKPILPIIEREVEFFIGNPFLLKEFNSIKGWFKRKLKIERITVFTEIKLYQDEITVLTANSKEVELINNELIDAIQIERVTNLASKITQSNQDDFLFSLDEVFQVAEIEDFGGNLFGQSENEILDILLKKGNIRNEIHLRYLANNVQSVQCKIQFTFMPKFGFLFSHIDKNNSHYILELLNSNATYIWKFPTGHEDINHFYLLNEELKKLYELKRRNYRNQADESIFQIVVHTGVGKGEVDIASWKQNLKEALK